jgi:hypothetical protein
MLFLTLTLAWLRISPAGSPANDPREVVSAYLRALEALDHDAMERYWAPGLVWVHADGSEEPASSDSSRKMRAFERGMRTSWTSRIRRADGERVEVEMTEKNDFYDLLGVGKRSQRETYSVRDGRIHRSETREVRHERGDFRTEYARFKAWLLKTDAARDPALVRDGGLVFDGPSAERMRRWLERWKREQR